MVDTRDLKSLAVQLRTRSSRAAGTKCMLGSFQSLGFWKLLFFVSQRNRLTESDSQYRSFWAVISLCIVHFECIFTASFEHKMRQ